MKIVSNGKLLIVIIICLNTHSSFETETKHDDFFSEYIYFPSGNNIDWPSKQDKDNFIQQGKFNPQDMIPTRHLFYNNSVIIVFPKFRRGVPFSVAIMNINDKDRCEPELQPYPSWADHNEENCDSIINAVDIFIDPNDIIWLLDVGIVNTLDESKVQRAPKVFGINAKTSKTEFIIQLDSFTDEQSRLQFIVAEKIEDDTLLYISDAGTQSIIIYNVHAPKGFRVLLPEAINAGSLKRDVLYLTIIHKNREQASLYFTYLGGKELYKVKTERFRLGLTQGSIASVGYKPRKLVLLGTDNGRNLFFRFQGDSVIYLWNTETELHFCNFILVKRPEQCRMATHVVAGYRRLMWMLESNFHDYMSGNLGSFGASARILPLFKICSAE